jgi:organic radical activating enzyme
LDKLIGASLERSYDVLEAVTPTGVTGDVVTLTTQHGCYFAGGHLVKNCDTNFANGIKLSLDDIIARLDAAWGDHPHGRSEHDARMVVISGGEPTLQLDPDLVTELKRNGWYVAIETNGTNDNQALTLCDHVCVSPKRGSELQVYRADELKVILPGSIPNGLREHEWTTEELHELATSGEWGELFVQPQDVTETAHVEQTYLHSIRSAKPGEYHPGAVQFAANVKACLDFLDVSPGWRLSYQVHKTVGIK